MDKLNENHFRTSTKLRLVADMIESLEPEQFHMGVWYQERRCNTVACAAGWTATLFQGLELKPTNNVDGDYVIRSSDPNRRCLNSLDAVAQVLGIRDYEGMQLLYPCDQGRIAQFGGLDCDTPKAVAWQFRRLADKYALDESL